MLLKKINDYKLEIIVFTSGACVMILEMVGSRVLAPFLGTSIIVWTSLIGLILGSLSLGYWYGGQLADKNPNYKTFAAIIFLAGAAIAITALFKTYILETIQQISYNIKSASVLATVILFSPASIFLGMISPYAVRLKMTSLSTSGTTVGALYAISTIGSIAGTFLSGFVLISLMGHTKILYLLSAILALVSIYAAPNDKLKIKSLFIMGVAILTALIYGLEARAEKKGIIQIDTKYTYARIRDITHKQTGRKIRILETDPFTTQSAVFLEGDDDLVFDYTKFYRLADIFNPNPDKVLLLGGGAYTFPKDFLKRHPESTMDVVEIDPKFNELAKKYFNLKNNIKGLNDFHEDARTFLNKTKGGYDTIYVDIYRDVFSIPYQLTTKEAITKMYNALKSDGILLANIISALEGKKSKFIQAEYKTYKTIFPHVYLFQVNKNINPDKGRMQNIILVAFKSKAKPALQSNNKNYKSMLNSLLEKEIKTNLPILTDEYAPVDQYMLSAY